MRHHLVRVDALHRLLLEVVLHRVADDRQPRGAAHQDDRVDVRRRSAARSAAPRRRP